MRTWIKVTLNIILALALIVASVIFTIYTDTFDKHKRYTYDDLQDAYNIGYEKSSTTITELQTKIQSLEDMIQLKDGNEAKYQAEIEKYKSELQIYINGSVTLVTVTLYVDDVVHQIIDVRQNGSILTNIEIPVKAGYTFVGWSNGENIIDCTTYKFTEDVSLSAVFEKIQGATCVINVTFEPAKFPAFTGDYIYELSDVVCNIVLTSENYENEITTSYSEDGNTYTIKELGNDIYSVSVTSAMEYIWTEIDMETFEISNVEDVISINIIIKYYLGV